MGRVSLPLQVRCTTSDYDHENSHEFEWKREECYMIRKPDPPVMVAVAKEPPGKIKTTAVQILDYNLNRWVDINVFRVLAEQVRGTDSILMIAKVSKSRSSLRCSLFKISTSQFHPRGRQRAQKSLLGRQEWIE